MAHRTLLLLVLAVVIVALAAISGIFAFAEGAAKNRQEMIVDRCVGLSTYSQEWVSTPSSFGGGGGSFENVDIWRVTQQSGTGEWMIEDGTRYSVEPIEGEPLMARMIAEDEELGLRVEMVFDGNAINGVDYLRTGITYIPNPE